MRRPLDGIRVLEWGIFHAGPGGSAILCDMGAEVIKIEQPVTGDPIRKLSRYKDLDFSFGNDRNIFFEGANRGKKSITIDLSKEEGRQITYRLAKECDVFMTNLRPKTVEAAGMDYTTLALVNPKLIYAGVSCYGSQGPDGNRGGFDYQGQGRSGFMYSLGEPSERPGLAQFAVADQTTAILGSYQVVIALLMRERFGVGQKVDTSLLGTLSYMMYFNYLSTLITGRDMPKHDQLSADPLRNYYQCKDGKWIVQNQTVGDDIWYSVCEVLGMPDLGEDPRYSSREKRIGKSKELVARFNQAFLKKTKDEWIKLFQEKDLVICAVNTVREAIQDPQMAANGYLVDFDHPDLGKIQIPGFPIRFSEAEINHNLDAPRLGEHTESVLKAVGKYTDEEIDQFKKAGII